MSVSERIKKIAEEWFLREPLLFVAYCSHELMANFEMDVPIRTGNRRIEYSPKLLERFSNEMLEEFLKFEVFRILLKHPYQRQPPFARKALLTMASNITVDDVYDVPNAIKNQMNGTKFSMPSGLCFEEYYAMLSNWCLSEQTAVDAQISELWEEDDEACGIVSELIEAVIASNTWGSISGRMQDLIKAGLKVDLDYRKMLGIFRTSIMSSKYYLTRMRPNRRLGFDVMGRRYKLMENLLVAIDVSGSVTNESISFFLSVVNRFFKYGVEKVDVLQFDTEIKGGVKSLNKAQGVIEVLGRGETSFQPIADYYCAHPEYDGLIFFTDGCANPPVYNTKRSIDVLWVLCGKYAYMQNSDWIRKIKRNRVTYIPRKNDAFNIKKEAASL